MTIFLSIGSGPGIGFATAERFAREGFQVILSARNAAKTRKLTDQLNAKGYKAEAQTVDAGVPWSVTLSDCRGGEAVRLNRCAALQCGLDPKSNARGATAGHFQCRLGSEYRRCACGRSSRRIKDE